MMAPEVLESDLANAVALLKNLQEQVMAVTAEVQALTKKVPAKTCPTGKGLSLLEVKDQLLLTHIMDLSHLILPKFRDWWRIRTVLEKLHPLDQYLKHQNDKLVQTAATGRLRESDLLCFKPRPSNIMRKLSSEDEEEDGAEEGQSGASGKKAGKVTAKNYVPARYDETDACLEGAKRWASSSFVIRELKQQYADAPEEIRDARHPHVTGQSQEHQLCGEATARLSVHPREKGQSEEKRVPEAAVMMGVPVYVSFLSSWDSSNFTVCRFFPWNSLMNLLWTCGKMCINKTDFTCKEKKKSKKVPRRFPLYG
uniref:Uncharacterized protein n=1 Tax=Sus scrofa TaxID=9823 RepID=A0A8D1U183_PIG